MTKYTHIIGTGSSAPDNILTTSDLEKMVDTSDEWIVSRTGNGISGSFLKSNGKQANLLTVPAGSVKIPVDPVDFHDSDR